MVGRSKLGKMVRGSSEMVGGKLTKMVGGGLLAGVGLGKW
jgi:hypothetical protein